MHPQITILYDYKALPLVPAGFELIADGAVLGIFHGTLYDGIAVEVQTENVKGRVRMYLQNGNKVWQRVALVRNSPNGTIQEDYLVIRI